MERESRYGAETLRELDTLPKDRGGKRDADSKTT